jgi:hypothetical protein
MDFAGDGDDAGGDLTNRRGAVRNTLRHLSSHCGEVRRKTGCPACIDGNCRPPAGWPLCGGVDDEDVDLGSPGDGGWNRAQ